MLIIILLILFCIAFLKSYREGISEESIKQIKKAEEKTQELSDQIEKDALEEAAPPSGAGQEVANKSTPYSKYKTFFNEMGGTMSCEERCIALYKTDPKFVGSSCECDMCVCKFNEATQEEGVNNNQLENFYRKHGRCLQSRS